MVQLAPAITVVPQVLVWEKSPAFVPVIVMPEMVSEAVPALVRVTVCAVLLVHRPDSSLHYVGLRI